MNLSAKSDKISKSLEQSITDWCWCVIGRLI